MVTNEQTSKQPGKGKTSIEKNVFVPCPNHLNLKVAKVSFIISWGIFLEQFLKFWNEIDLFSALYE